ncbi:hypothetical protein [Sphingomonas aerolata]|uniref:hypothetical protein n=1 Tax=Sphingomonas aerolata TaxID=185951 RepID=UPI00335FF72F
MRKFIITAALCAITAMPATANAAPNSATSLSVAKSARVSTPTVRKNTLVGPTLVVALLATVVIVGGAVLLVTSDDDDSDSN